MAYVHVGSSEPRISTGQSHISQYSTQSDGYYILEHSEALSRRSKQTMQSNSPPHLPPEHLRGMREIGQRLIQIIIDSISHHLGVHGSGSKRG